MARQIRHRLLIDELQRYQDESGTFTQEELADARTRLFDAADVTEDTTA
nr:hypothetical protein [Frankia sp. Cj3]